MSIKVLVVDHTRITEQLCKDTLAPLGCQIITASSTALGLFLARKNFPSLIVYGVDVDSDEEVDLPQEIRTDPDLSHIPVVLVTTAKDHSSTHLHKQTGAAKILKHPLSPERFFDELRPYLVEAPDKRPSETPE